MKSYNWHRFNEPIITKNLIILVLFLYIFWLFKSYSGNHHSVYLHMWKYVAGTFSFENDIWLQRSNQPQVSILYHVFKVLRINIDNDYMGFFLHITFSTISGFFLFKILKDYVPIKETNASLVIIFALLMIGQILVTSNISSWVIRWHGMPTYFGHQLIFVLIWLLLSRKFFWLLIISSFMLSIALRATWFSVAIAILYSILFIRPIKKNIWIVGPLTVLAYLSSLGNIPSDYETRLLLFNSVLERGTVEVAFHFYSKINLIALMVSFVVYFFMLKKNEENDFKKLALVILISSIICFIGGYFYGLYGAKVWPEPRLLALSATRALGIYQLFFWILLAQTIYKFNLYQIYKVVLLSSIFYLCTLSLDSALFSLLILVLSFFLITFYKYSNFLNIKKLILNKSLKFSYLSTLLFFLILTPGITYLFIGGFKHVDLYALKRINKWTMGSMAHDNVRLDTALMLQKCDDFVLLDLKHRTWTSAIAGKSNYWGNVFFNHMDPTIYRLVKKRTNILLSIEGSLEKKQQLNARDKEELLKTGVVLIINDNKREFFPDDITTIDIKNSDTLLLFLNNDKRSSFLTSCKPLLKI